jgi:hypothetical protein
MSDLPPLPWCEPNTHLKNMCFWCSSAFLVVSDGFSST